MTKHGKDAFAKMGFPSHQIDWSNEEEANVGASFAELADLLESKGEMCPICGLPINKRTHPWNAKYGCQ